MGVSVGGLIFRLIFYILLFVMKKNTHPENYREVIFLDTSSGEKFLLWSTIETAEKDKWSDGAEYPLAKVEISSASHPFYTGKETVIDTAGRVEKFRSRKEKAQPVVKKSKKKIEKIEKKTTKNEKKEAEDPKATKGAPAKGDEA